jgi:molecular chaperone IbpA
MALAGYSPSDISITTSNGYVTVATTKEYNERKDTRKYIRHGIAARSFTQTFTPCEYVKVTGADFKNGMLSIHFEYNLPEELKPQTVTINEN